MNRVADTVVSACLFTFYIVALTACRLDVGTPGAAGAVEAAPALAPRGIIRSRCPPRGVALAPVRSIPTPAPVERVLLLQNGLSQNGLLAVTEVGLHLWRGDRWELLLEGGRDYVLESSVGSAPDTIARLGAKQVEFFAWESGRARRVRSVAVRSHDSSLALTPRALILHSPVDRDNHLVIRRARLDGQLQARWITVERDFPHLFMHDFEGLLKSTGQVRAQGRWVAFVPLLENPIRLIDIESSTIVDLHTAARRAGRVTTVAREVVRDEQACPTCRREVHEVSSHRFEAVHADAVFAEESLWILGTEEPGSTEAVVYRFPLHWLRAPRDRVGDAIGLTSLASPPRALAIAYDHIIVATEDRLYWFERSRLERRWLGRPSEARGRSREGGACEAS